MSTATRLTYVGHATVLIEIDGVRLLTDPVLTQRVVHLRRQTAPIDLASYQNIDAILISHLHADHLHLPSLSMLDVSTRVIAPVGAAQLLSRLGFSRIDELRTGEAVDVGALSIRSTHAEHHGFRFPCGPAASAMGFVARGYRRVYFAGDTDLFDEMADLEPELDVALLPVWGWGPTIGRGHLTPWRAAQALSLIQPRMAIPIHWGTYLPIAMGWIKPSFLTRPPEDFAAAARLLAPRVEVRVVPPGATIHLDGEMRNAKT